MISFKILSEDNLDNLSCDLGERLGDAKYVGEILSSFMELVSEGVEIALSDVTGCLLTRIYDDGRYSFVYPIQVCEDANVSSALIAVSEYTRREMIPLFFTDAPRDELGRLGEIFPHIEARAYDEDEDGFVVSVLSECDMLEGIPNSSYARISLGELLPGDAVSYARLCRDEEVNRYWGYDYKEDAPYADAEYFVRVAEVEFRRGIALTLAVRLSEGDGSLIGEAVLFDFDYFGSAMLAIRLLSEYQGHGLGKEVLIASLNIARSIGLKRVRARVKRENIPSIRMAESAMTRHADEGDEAVFSVSLE